MGRMHFAFVAVIFAVTLEAGTPLSSLTPALAKRSAKDGDTTALRRSVLARAQAWTATDIPSLEIKRGPQDRRGFVFQETVTCDYLNKKLGGRSPKFACTIPPDDELKVKYGGNNGEVYGEVAATRLLWALGFGADHMYPVRVECRGCPEAFNGIRRSKDVSLFDPAAVERKFPGKSFSEEGWSWEELDVVDESAGGASRAQVDALKLLAVFLQHADTKPEQQRLVCLDEPKNEGDTACERPFLLLSDLGLTFGRSNRANHNTTGGMNLVEWAKIPVWKQTGTGACVGNLPKSFTGTLGDPPISESGRQFLARLLVQLTDDQIHDIFETARVTLRLREPGRVNSGFATVDDWVKVFKDKRDQIINRTCA